MSPANRDRLDPWVPPRIRSWGTAKYWDRVHRRSPPPGVFDDHDVDLLLDLVTWLGPELDLYRALDAGCGKSHVPRYLAMAGMDVLAVDLSEVAIAAVRRPVSQDALCRLLPRWVLYEPGPDSPLREVEAEAPDPFPWSRRGRDPRPPDGRYLWSGGSVRHEVRDWFELDDEFDLVHCRNGLRCATPDYWLRSLTAYERLLRPGGVLWLEHTNARSIASSVEALCQALGFARFSFDLALDRPTQKWVVYCWHSG